MTKEQFEKSPVYADAKHIYDNREFAEIEHLRENIIVQVIDRTYPIYDWIELYLTYLSIMASDEHEPDVGNQLQMLVEARSAIVHLVERINRDINQEYIFGGFLSQIDALIKMSEAELHVKLLKSQVATNLNVIKTNNKMFWILLTSILVSVVSVFTAIIAIKDNRSDNTLKDKIITQDKLLLMKESQLQNEVQKKDSLEILLLKKSNLTRH